MVGGIGGMAGAGGANPLGGMAGGGSGSGIGGSLGGMAEIGGNEGGNAGSGLVPTQPASSSQGAAFGDTLRGMLIEAPSVSKAQAGELATRFAAGDTSVDAHSVAIASAKAGVEIQMATRTISSAVSAVRTLFQMQI